MYEVHQAKFACSHGNHDILYRYHSIKITLNVSKCDREKKGQIDIEK